MSPLILAVPAIQPSQEAFFGGSGGGITWATGTPFFVMSNGLPVFRTSSTTARQVALNLEIAIVFISAGYYGH